MATTPHLGLTLVEQAQAQKEVTVNTAFMRLDALLNAGVTDKDLSTPPGAPATGDVYIVGAAATGDWAAQENNIAYFEQVWRFVVPNEGMMLWVNDEDKHYVFDGSAWTPTAASINALDDLSDVVIAAPADGEVLVYDSVSGGWKNDAATGSGSGESNTASNVGTAGVGLFKQKAGVDFEFKKLNAGSAKVTVVDDTGNDEVDIDIVPGNINIGDLFGAGALAGLNTVGTAQIDDGAVSYAKIQDISTTDRLLGRVTAGAGSVEEIPCTAFARSMLDDADAATMRGTLGFANASTIDNAIVRFDGVSGATQASNVIISDNDELHGFKTAINQQAGTGYTLAATDSGKVVECNNAAAITVTLPNSLPVGFSCTIMQKGAGQVGLEAAIGATLHNRQGHTKAAGQYALVTLYVSENSDGSSAVYVMGGDSAL